MDRGESTCKLLDLAERHYALLYRYAYRLTGSEADAEDLTQQAFLVAQAKLEQLRDESCAKAWLFAIVRNVYLKEIRTKGCLPAMMTLEHVAEPHAPLPHEAEFDQEQLQNVLNDLPEEFRSPVILFYFEEFSYKEIAEYMAVPIGTIMSRLARAKAYLRQRLTEHQTAAVKQDVGLQQDAVLHKDVAGQVTSRSWRKPGWIGDGRLDEGRRETNTREESPR